LRWLWRGRLLMMGRVRVRVVGGGWPFDFTF
jgi:hypothetical protein